jgi:hypothetical protein
VSELSLIVSYKLLTVFVCGETVHTVRLGVSLLLAVARRKKITMQ